jgi:hypothetical protein
MQQLPYVAVLCSEILLHCSVNSSDLTVAIDSAGIVVWSAVCVGMLVRAHTQRNVSRLQMQVHRTAAKRSALLTSSVGRSEWLGQHHFRSALTQPGLPFAFT